MASAINWFEIPAVNFERAVEFYSKVLASDLARMNSGFDMAFLPHSEGSVGGCVTHGNGNKPSAEGAFIYLNGGDDLAVPLARVEPAGGTVVMPKTAIGPNGFMAVFMDTEGNRLAFHSMA